MRTTATAGWDIYADRFRAIARGLTDGIHPDIDLPHLVGVQGSAEHPDGRLLVTDDAACPALRNLNLQHTRMIVVVSTAARCLDLAHELPGFLHERGTAMVAPTLDDLPEDPVDPALTIRRLGAAAGEIAFETAAAANIAADPGEDGVSPSELGTYLHSIPGASLFAATDRDGIVRATAGSAVIGTDARVFFVSTDHAWRGRGIGTAMTSRALQAARDRGAVRACLEASPAGRAIYLRLGFIETRPVDLFWRTS